MRSIAYVLGSLALLACCQNVKAQYEDWWDQGPTGMSGIGAVSKVEPSFTSCLHWAGGPNPWQEAAYFTLNVNPSDLHDCDTRHWWDGYVWHADPYENAPGWLYLWGASSGEMSTNGMYYAPDEINDSVNIWCDIHDAGTYIDHYDEQGRPVLAYASGAAGESLHRDWNGFLKIYKVGIFVQPANVQYWEDSTETQRFWTVYDDLSLLFCHTNTTYASTRSATAVGTGWTFVCTWQTITLPTACDIIHNVTFYPEIAANGLLDMECWGDGLDFGSASNIVTTLAGLAGTIEGDPYRKALGAVVATLASGDSDANAGIAMDSVIQFIDKAGGSAEVEHFVGFADWDPVFCGSANVSALNAWGYARYKPGITTEGSVSVNTKVSVNDDHILMYHGAQIIDGGSGETYLKYGASRPEYGS
jgi:hypothetical protein